MTAPGVYLDPCAGQLLESVPVPRQALFLDRDGVINLDLGYVHRREETHWLPGIFDLVALARSEGMLPIVLTNQAGIARGLYSEEAFLQYTGWMHRQFSERGVPLLATIYCPHHPTAGVGDLKQDCACRKPAPGMILEAARTFDLDLRSSILVGNNESDMLAARGGDVGTCVLLAHGCPSDYRGVASSKVTSLADIQLPPALSISQTVMRHA